MPADRALELAAWVERLSQYFVRMASDSIGDEGLFFADDAKKALQTAALLRSQAADLEKARADADALAEALRALVSKLDIVHDATVGAFQFMAIHGMLYDGPNYADELTGARAALARHDGGKV